MLTPSVSCFTDSTVDREFVALLKDTDELDDLQNTLGAERALSPPRKQISPPSGKIGYHDERIRGEGY